MVDDLIGRHIGIPTPYGDIDSYVAHPHDSENHPLVLLFMDIWGLREELFGIARRIAAQGYYCILPNSFYREGKFRYEPRNAEGRMMSFDTLPDHIQDDMRARGRRVNRRTAHEDISVILDFCRNEPVRAGAAGSVGFCLGGLLAFYAGQDFAERFRASASLHGSRLVTDEEDLPHRLTHKMRGEVYCGFAEFDHTTPPESARVLSRALQDQSNLVCHLKMHPGAHHGYALPDRDIYNHAAAEADWESIFAMLQRQLLP